MPVTTTDAPAGSTLQVTVTLFSGDTVCVDELPAISEDNSTEHSLVGDMRRRLEQLVPLPVGAWYFFFEESCLLGENDRVFANRNYTAVRSQHGVQKFPGFTEHAYRLVFFYGQKYASYGGPWHLRTILPNGTVDQDRNLPPGSERGLIAYAYPQSLPDEHVEAHRGTPWVWTRPDGSHALVQTWPTQYNNIFKQKFNPQQQNPDPTKFDEAAVSEFQQCLVEMFSQQDVDEIGIKYCHSETINDKAAYVGSAEALISFLTEHPEVRNEMDILQMGATLDGPDAHGFICRYVDGKGRTGTKGFSMNPACNYVLYTKKGWETMACIKLFEHFEREADLTQPGVLVYQGTG